MDQKFLFALTKPGKNGGKFLHFTAVGYYFLLTFGVLFTCIHIVYPAITKNQDEKFWNIVYLSYIFFNMMGNYFMGLFFQSDLKTGIALADPPKSWIYCKECKQHSPPRSHHCSICNACILKHDHHCFFLCQCVGLKNQRYFIIYNFYVAIGSVFAARWLLLYLAEYYIPLQWTLYSIFSYFFPGFLYNWLFTEIPVTFSSALCMLVFYGCLTTGAGCFFLFITQCILVIRGQTLHEFLKNRHGFRQKWSKNIVNVFGSFLFIFASFLFPLPLKSNEEKSPWGLPNFYKYV